MRIAGGAPRHDGTVTHQPDGIDEQGDAEAASRVVLRPIARSPSHSWLWPSARSSWPGSSCPGSPSASPLRLAWP